MAAVCTLPISVCSCVDILFQMVKRVPQSPDVDRATAAFKRMSLGAPPTQLRTPSGGAMHRHGPVFPSGMAARRNKPLFKLSDITGEREPGGSAAGAGPVAFVPDDEAWPPRSPAAATDTPFANFGKIVYALLLLVCLYSAHPSVVTHLVRSISAAKRSFTPQGSTFPMDPPLPSTWINFSSVKSSVTVPTVPSSEYSINLPTYQWR